jgi:hypothetical protein
MTNTLDCLIADAPDESGLPAFYAEGDSAQYGWFCFETFDPGDLIRELRNLGFEPIIRFI